MSEITDEELEKFDRHIAKEAILELNDGDKVDKFVLKPLPLKELPSLFKIFRAFSKIKPGNEAEFFDNLNEEVSNTMMKLALNTVKRSYPDMPDEKLESFVSNNFMPILTKIFEINDLGMRKIAPRALAKIKKMRGDSDVEKQ